MQDLPKYVKERGILLLIERREGSGEGPS